MKKYSSNYCTINNNYIININKETKRIKKENLYSTFCIVQNILQRGMPTKPSNFLRNSIGEYKKSNSLRFITTELQVWDNTIKGYNEANDNPALIFYKKILPFELKEYGFITNLIIPEVKIKEITEDNNKEFVNNYVDFYFPQCKLVIEIDGVQHEGELDKIKDKERDIYFKKFGITTLRITAKEIKEYMKGNKTSILEKIESIYDMCKENDEINYNKKTIESDKSEIENIMIYDSIMRFQILLLELLKVEMLNLEEKQWVFNIKNHDVKFPYLIALQDLINWIKNILSLQGNKINNIDFIINEVDNFEKVNNGINVDFSLLKKWDDNCFEEEICFIRGEYFYERNYFKVATAEPIKYKVITELEENSNVENLYMLNKDIFGFDRFNNGQLPIIINALSLQDTIGLLPTGGGKSLCYQLSCLLQPTINFVVVPIKSLMYDQKLNLDKKGIVHTQFINSDQEGEEKEEIINNFANEKYFYTWISPERFQTEGFREQLRKINSNSNIGYAVIDEVHCLSEWGHDFRTSYLNLSKTIKKLCPSAVFLGLTATASKNVLKDILVEFEIEESNVKTIIDYTRPELSFKVIQDCRNINEDKEKNLISLLNTLDQNENVFELNGEKSKCGLIFTPHVNWKYGCYGIMNSLQQNERFKGKVKYYSGEVPKIKKAPIMSESDFNIYKSKVQEEFQNNEFPLLTATKAFGMGVDKGNIRYTIHYGIPGSVESFYQEAGRAGRDKEKANCYILHSKDIIDEEDYNKLFNINTTVEELKVFTEKYKFQSGDILRNLFLAINNNKGVGEECFLTFGIYKYLCLKKKKVISIDDVKALKIKYKNNIVTSDFQSVQKAIYRLSSLGVIEDWTIDGWNNNGKFIIYYGDTDEDSIKTSLESFINKYDSEFSFNKLNSKKYEKYNNMYIREDVPTVLKYIFILIQWNYDNVFYNRRQSQKNLVDLCDSYSEKGEKYFKEVLEGYFRITNETYILDYISNNPNDLEELYNLIFDENNVLKKYEHFKAIKLSLTRFLESYRYNTALNYLSGICGLILKEYDLFTKDRFREAFVSIMEKDEDTQMEIFEKTLSIGERLEKEEKDKLSEILNEFYKDKYKIYERLKDNVSLNYILEEKIQKLTEIGEEYLVNIDKLNATIENLDIKAKEIEGIVNIQKKIEKIVNKVEEINVRLNTEKSNINEITKEVDKINKKSKEVIHSVENLLGEKFQDYDNIIKNNNNKILNLEKEIKIIASDFNETKNTVSNLIDNFTEVENNIKDLNKCLIKEVSEIKLENYKIINEFQGILESKVALLKSDLVLEARNNNESLNLELNSLDSKLKNLEGKLSIAEDKLNNFDSKLNDLDNKINIRIDDITSKIEKNNTNSDVRYNKISTEFEELNYMNNKIKNEITEKLIKSEKKNTVLMVISIILILINIGVLFLK